MKKKIILAAVMAAASLFTGCALQTVNEMYSLPKRSEEYNSLQSAIDMAMVGLEYCAPQSGENQQTVQMADLDGDGVEEYLVFAKGSSEKPLQILIFRQNNAGNCELLEIIESKGSAFEQVEYVQIDDSPGCEIVIGRQVSDEVMRNVSVYSISDGAAVQLVTAGYYKFLTCDLDSDGKNELMVIQPGDADTHCGVTVLYSFRQGMMERSMEAELSEKAENIKRIMAGRIQGGTPAVYVASAVNEDAIITDIFALKNGRFTNISISNDSGTSVQTLRNYYLYADDVDDDGILELPSLVKMKAVSQWEGSEKQYLIRWYAMDIHGEGVDKMHSFHNYAGGWYLQLNSDWAERVTVDQVGNTYAFYIWNEKYEKAAALFTLFALTGSDRETKAGEDDRFALYRAEGVIYAARLEASAEKFEISSDTLINSFHLIHQDWKSGET